MWRIRADGSRPARPLLFGGRGAYLPDIARTGNRLVYTKHFWDTNIWRVALQPSGRPAGAPEKFIQSNYPDYAVSWSPDGNSIAFASQRSGASQVWVCDAGGGNPRQLTSLNSTFGMEPQWSPDGAWIAFHGDADGNREIYVVGVAGGAARRLTADPADDSSPRWSADGKWVYFRSNRSGQSKVWKVAREGGPAVPAEGSVSEGADPDGVWRYSTKRAGAGFSIWRERAGGGEANKVLDGVALTEFAVTRKGIYHTVAGPEHMPWKLSVAFYEFATGKSVKVADLRPGAWSGEGPAVSPDGRYLLYTQCDVETDDLVLVENFR
jgi:Tol biopolymer transport system component